MDKKRLFWSGLGIHGDAKAAEWAKQNNAETLEMFLKKSGINAPSWKENPSFWKKQSKQFADEAVGDVAVLLGQDVSPQSIWSTIEKPALLNNDKVTSIQTIRLADKSIDETFEKADRLDDGNELKDGEKVTITGSVAKMNSYLKKDGTKGYSVNLLVDGKRYINFKTENPAQINLIEKKFRIGRQISIQGKVMNTIFRDRESGKETQCRYISLNEGQITIPMNIDLKHAGQANKQQTIGLQNSLHEI